MLYIIITIFLALVLLEGYQHKISASAIIPLSGLLMESCRARALQLVSCQHYNSARAQISFSRIRMVYMECYYQQIINMLINKYIIYNLNKINFNVTSFLSRTEDRCPRRANRMVVGAASERRRLCQEASRSVHFLHFSKCLLLANKQTRPVLSLRFWILDGLSFNFSWN